LRFVLVHEILLFWDQKAEDECHLPNERMYTAQCVLKTYSGSEMLDFGHL